MNELAMTIRGILFDKDGTLLDYAATWMPANRRVADHIADGDLDLSERMLTAGGYDPESRRIAAGTLLAAGSNREIAEHFAAYVPHRDVEEIYVELSDIYADHGAAGSVAVPDLARIVSRLKGRGLTLGVATSDSERGAYGSLKSFDVLDHMSFVAGYDSGHGIKPGPGMVHGFCDATGLAPGQVAVVGDNSHDMEMGRSAGAGLLVGVLTGTSEHDDLDPHAHHVLDSIAGLEALLERLMALPKE